jgi:hypothetical protein
MAAAACRHDAEGLCISNQKNEKAGQLLLHQVSPPVHKKRRGSCPRLF